MDFQRQWTQFALQAEHDHFGVARIVKAHNEQIATLQSQLAASQERVGILETIIKAEVYQENVAISAELELSLERERILREGLEEYAQTCNWAHTEMNSPHRNLWMRWESGYDVATATLKAAEEVKCTGK